ncbi:MAG: alpha/beta hydrolase [Propionibacteriaceae bacterium]|nr:alpha/beta hydrolase [Propionibacteriaceae bacterium]
MNSTVPELLDHMDTASVARDLDVLRGLAGDPKPYYLGTSYGTYLGARYAEIFPENVGRMVLDSAQDPSIQLATLRIDQAKSLERALGDYIKACQAGSDCALTGDLEAGKAQLREFVAKANATPIPSSDPNASLDGDTLISMLRQLLYDDQVWPDVDKALAKVIHSNDATDYFALSAPKTPEEDPEAAAKAELKKTQNMLNGQAIDCLDYPKQGDQAAWDAEAAKIMEVAPTMGEGLAYADAFCKGWGHHTDHQPTEVKASGAAPILVVGITGDPATPYEWSQALASQLDSGRLITVEGNGHGAYMRLGDCVNQKVDAYLLRGEVPAGDLTCQAELQQ